MNPACDSVRHTKRKASRVGCLTGFLGGWFGFVAGFLATNYVLDPSWPVLFPIFILIPFAVLLFGAVVGSVAFCALGIVMGATLGGHRSDAARPPLSTSRQESERWYRRIGSAARNMLRCCVGAVLGAGLVSGIGCVLLDPIVSGQYRRMGEHFEAIVCVVWCNYLLLGVPLGAVAGALLGIRFARNVVKWRLASSTPTGSFGGISFRQAMVSGADWTIAGIFPVAACIAVLDRFPVPFFGYFGGVGGVLPVVGGVLLYGIFGGFILLSAVGAIAGLFARVTSWGNHRVFVPLCLVAAIVTDVAVALLMARWGPIGPPVSGFWPW